MGQATAVSVVKHGSIGARFARPVGYVAALGLWGFSLLLAMQFRPERGNSRLLQGIAYGLCFIGTAAFFWARRNHESPRQRLRRLRLLIEGLKDYCVHTLDADGKVTSWDAGVQEIMGYGPQELIGRDFSCFYLGQDSRQDKPRQHLAMAAEAGRFEFEDWRVRKDGSCFWAHVVLISVRDDAGRLRGYCHATRDQTMKKQMELLEADRRRILEMVAQNQPLADILKRLVQVIERICSDAIVSVLMMPNGHIEAAGNNDLPAPLNTAVGEEKIDVVGALQQAHRVKGDTLIVRGAGGEGAHETLTEVEKRQGLRACVQMPICGPTGRLLGAFTCYYLEDHQPDSAETELLTTIAKLAAIAIEHRQLTDQLAHRAHHDPLTGLPNRILLDDRLRQALAQSARVGRSVGLLFIDLDRFKEINDTLGHEAGDELLREVCRRFQHHVRGSDTLARMGGDEFNLLLPDLHSRQDATRVAHKLLASLELPFKLAGHELLVSASVGVAVHPEDAADAPELLKNADMAMYRAKRSGKNRVECFAREMHATAMERFVLEEQLHRALDRNELELHYQPQIDRQGEIVGLESLIRWNHPQHVDVRPAKFIALAEDTGFILPLGRWILREACRQNKLWQEAGYAPLRIAVNVSVLQFAHPDFLEMLTDILSATGLDPRWLELELTESLLVQDTGSNLDKLARIREMGTGVAIDDFGTGYSSLAYLHQLPIDTLKIDESFIRSITSDDCDAPVVRAITSMAHSLGMKVVAEGVETEAQRGFVERVGCDGMQGFLLGRPVPAAEVPGFLRRGAVEAPLSALGGGPSADKQVA